MGQPQPLQIKGFTGGLADEELSVTPQHYTRADNLLLTSQADLITRPGSVCFDVAHARVPSNARVNGLINYDQDANLLAVSGAQSYAYSGGTWVQVSTPTGALLPGGTTAASVSTAEWKKHIFVATSEQLTPVKMYKDNGGIFQGVSAGLPFMATPNNWTGTTLTVALTLAIAIRAKMAAHFADTSEHKVADTVSAGLMTLASPVDLPTLLAYTAQLVKAYQNHFNDYIGPQLYHTAEVTVVYTTAGDQTILSTLAPTDLPSCAIALNDLRVRYNQHDGKLDIHTGFAGVHLVTANFILAAGGESPTAGPYIDLDRSLLYSVTNALRVDFLQHLLDALPLAQTTNAHKLLDSSNANDITNNYPVCTDPDSAALLLFGLWADYSEHELDAQKGAPSFHMHTEVANHDLPVKIRGAWVGGAFPPDLFAGCASGNWTKMVQRLNQYRTVILNHINEADITGTLAHQAGTTYYKLIGTNAYGHGYFADYLANGNEALTLGSYLYAFTYSFTYVINGVTFTTEGPPLLVEAQGVIAPEIEGLLVKGIVPLANAGSTNYDTASVKINIYRTVSGGQTLFFVDQIANGTTTYTDYTTDVALQQNRQIYTAGGVSDNEPAPPSKYVHVVDNYGYWGNILDVDGTPKPNRIRQSIAGSPDAVPQDYFIDLPEPNTGVSSVKGVRVAWTKKATYRLEGTIDQSGQGSISAVSISDSVGCVGGYGIVATDMGLIFPGSDGFYITNGYQVSKLSRDWRTTYLNLTRTDTISNMIYGALDKKTQRVWFTASSTGAENDSCYILDLNLPRGENAPWTTASNQSYFAPSAICVFSDQVIRGDSRGYVLKHDPAVTNDPKINTGTSANTWSAVPIFPDYRSPANDFGTIMLRKWVPRIVVKAKNLGNMSMQINSINDGGTNIAALAPIRYRGQPSNGTPSILSVGGGPTVASGGLPEYKRRFPSGSMRCSTKQIQIILAKVAITESDTLGLGTLNLAAKTLTVAGGAFTDYVDYVLALENDGYVREYTVVSNTGTVLTVSDPGAHLPANGNYKWVVRGYPKDEQWHIVDYLLYYDIMGTTQIYGGQTTGENS